MSTTTEKCPGCGAEIEVDPELLNDPVLQKWLGALMSEPDLCEACTQAEKEKRAQKAHEASAKAIWEESVPTEYRNTDPKHLEYPRLIDKAALGWVEGKPTGDDAPRRLFLGLVGPSGRCKTRIAARMVRALIWEGNRVFWLNSSRFQWACQKQFDDAHKAEANLLLRRCRSASWLVFDDIGSLKSTEIVADELYGLLEHRTSLELPMIWTSNETLEEMLMKLPHKPRARILSRLGGFANIIQM